jgi:hypothetical protein
MPRRDAAAAVTRQHRAVQHRAVQHRAVQHRAVLALAGVATLYSGSLPEGNCEAAWHEAHWSFVLTGDLNGGTHGDATVPGAKWRARSSPTSVAVPCPGTTATWSQTSPATDCTPAPTGNEAAMFMLPAPTAAPCRPWPWPWRPTPQGPVVAGRLIDAPAAPEEYGPAPERVSALGGEAMPRPRAAQHIEAGAR